MFFPHVSARSAKIQIIAVCETVAESASSAAWANVPRMATMKAAVIVLECPGSSPWSAPSRTAAGANNQAPAESGLSHCTIHAMLPSRRNDTTANSYCSEPFRRRGAACFGAGVAGKTGSNPFGHN